MPIDYCGQWVHVQACFNNSLWSCNTEIQYKMVQLGDAQPERARYEDCFAHGILQRSEHPLHNIDSNWRFYSTRLGVSAV